MRRRPEAIRTVFQYAFPSRQKISSRGRFFCSAIREHLLPVFRPYVREYIGAILLMILLTSLALLPPYLVKILIDVGIRRHLPSVIAISVFGLFGITLVGGLLQAGME